MNVDDVAYQTTLPMLHAAIEAEHRQELKRSFAIDGERVGAGGAAMTR